MILRILLILTMWVGLMFATTVEKYHSELQKLDYQQKVDMMFAYAMGIDDDLGLVLAAIAWKESNFGEVPVNVSDGKYGSYSMFHILLDYAAIRHSAKSNYAKNQLASKLLQDKKFAAREAIGTLKYFKKKGCELKCQIASYNAGGKGLSNPKGKKYAEDILMRMRALHKHFSKNDLYVKIGSIVADVNREKMAKLGYLGKDILEDVEESKLKVVLGD